MYFENPYEVLISLRYDKQIKRLCQIRDTKYIFIVYAFFRPDKMAHEPRRPEGSQSTKTLVFTTNHSNKERYSLSGKKCSRRKCVTMLFLEGFK